MNRIVSVLAGAALVTTLAGSSFPALAQDAPKEATAPQDTGNVLAERGELDKALAAEPNSRVAMLEKFLADHPNSALGDQAREALVRTYATFGEQALKSSDPKGAAAAFKRALGAAPEKMSDRLFAQVIWQMPVLMAASGYRYDGIQLMRSFEPRFETDAGRLALIGNFYTSVESAPDAIRVLEKGAAVEPNEHRIHTALGTAYIISLRLDDAAAEFAKAIELDPKEEFAYTGLANLRRATGNVAEAIDLYKKQLAVKPDDAASFGGLAVAYLMNDDEASASNALGRALALAPNDFRLYTELAYFYASRGRTDKAREAVELSLRYEPRFSWTHIALGNILLAEKRYKEAIEALNQAQAYGDFPTLHFELGKAYLVSDQYDAAIDQFKASFDITEDGQFETSLGDVLNLRTSKLDMLLERERQAVLFLSEQPTTPTQYRLAESVARIGYALDSIPDETVPRAASAAPNGGSPFGGIPAGAAASLLVSTAITNALVVQVPQSSTSHAAKKPSQEEQPADDQSAAPDQTPAGDEPAPATRARKVKRDPSDAPAAPATDAPTSPAGDAATSPSGDANAPASDSPASDAPSMSTSAGPDSDAPTTDAATAPTTDAASRPAGDAASQPAATGTAAPTGPLSPSNLTVTPAAAAAAPAAPERAPSGAPAGTPAARTTHAEVPPAEPGKVFSSDPAVTPGDAALVFRPRHAPATTVAAAPGNAGATTASDAPPAGSDATAAVPTTASATEPGAGNAQPASTATDVATPAAATPSAQLVVGKTNGRDLAPALRDSLGAAIDAFVGVDDGREPFRKIWVARRLAEKNVLLDRAEKLATEALDGATAASEAERSVRDLPELDRGGRLAVLTARAEDTLGWVLLKRGARDEAIAHLARATEGVAKDPDLRQRYWHYGVAKQESGDDKGALDLFIRGYDPSAPSAPVRRQVIEQLYKRVNNGSLDGLDSRLGNNN